MYSEGRVPITRSFSLAFPNSDFRRKRYLGGEATVELSNREWLLPALMHSHATEG